MELTTEIVIDMRDKYVNTIVDAVQYDKNSRIIKATLLSGGSRFSIPTGATFRVNFKRADGANGSYTKLSDGSAAVVRSETNVLKIGIDELVTNASGKALISVSIIDGASEINTFSFIVNVQKAVTESSDLNKKYPDTYDGTATSSSIEEGKTAYSHGEKVTGTLTVEKQLAGESSGISQQSLRKWVNMEGTPGTKCIVNTETVVKLSAPLTEFGNAEAVNVMKGKTFTSAAGLLVKGTHECEEGLDTSDATAGAENVEYGMTAYAKGEKITGMLEKAQQLSGSADSVSRHSISGGITVKGKPHGKFIVDVDTSLSLTADKELFGDASAADVAKGKTFTSASGLKAEGSLNEATILTKTGGSVGFNLNNNGVVVSATQDTDVLLRGGSQVSVTASYDKFGDAQASDVVKGKKFTSAAGLTVTGTHVCEGGIDTSDATATATDMLAGTTAYVNGEKIEGTLIEVPAGSSLPGNTEQHVLEASDNITSVGILGENVGDGVVVRPGAKIVVRVPKSEYGDATASDVAKGKTFTSAAGVRVEGTNEGGGGEEVFFSSSGLSYKKDMVYPDNVTGKFIIPVGDAPELVSIDFNNFTELQELLFRGSFPSLKRIKAPKITIFLRCFWVAQNETFCDLEEVVFGSIGFPVTVIAGNCFSQSAYLGSPEITVYVNANSIADIVSDVKNNAPWGATNATIIYRNSTTGEVITE